jgi:hypothetical protein
MVEKNASNYFHPTWKLTFCTMVTKVLRTTSWILMWSLPWVQCTKWILIELIGCVHTHQMRLTIKDMTPLTTLKTLWRKPTKIIELKSWEDWLNYKLNTHPKARTW